MEPPELKPLDLADYFALQALLRDLLVYFQGAIKRAKEQNATMGPYEQPWPTAEGKYLMEWLVRIKDRHAALLDSTTPAQDHG